ncbi:MAG TPA: thioesterase family protein [Polyangiales bacterium]|nr:thioesterase family protein [Polyangiales bacterium]
MNEQAVFTRDGDRFVPGPYAVGPWAADRLHGGPVLGLIARAVEAAEPDPALVLARLTVDLFRSVPLAPLDLRIESLRKGSRLVLLRASVLDGEGSLLAQGSALLLRASDAAQSQPAQAMPAVPAGPDGVPTESLMRGAPPGERPSGFHTRVETRWVPRADEQPVAIWFRLPIALVAGEQASPLVSAVAVSDFTNAVAAIAAGMRNQRSTPFINTDTTLYLGRRPEGEWFCLQEQSCMTERGISQAQVALFDSRGLLGHALQARLTVR